ncbi:MAG TPA: hypothetical protein VG405_01310 [Solirubrobacteraceae bacterium]|nr:hypothetical protein [Solirubrobacteraceae bacterium]
MTEQSPPEPPLGPTGQPLVGAQPTAASSGVDFAPAGSSPGLAERPEVRIAATFAGGVIAATILKRLAR